MMRVAKLGLGILGPTPDMRGIYLLGLLSACTPATTPSQEPTSPPSVASITDGAQLLEAATEALAGARNYRYRYTYRGTGSVQGTYDGTVALRRGASPGEGRILAHVRGTASSRGSAEDVTILVSGPEIQRIDHGRRRLEVGTVGKSAHLMGLSYYAVLTQLLGPGPFAPELAAGDIEVEGTDSVAGVECDVVHAHNQSFGSAEVWWYLGKHDHLPRAQRWVVTTPGADGEFRFEIHDLDTGELADTDLDFSAAGFERVDEDARIVEVGSPAPAWSLRTAAGERVDAASLRGTVVVLDFWASWCPPCRRIMPMLDGLAREHGDRVRFFAVDTWESDGVDPRPVLDEQGIGYPILLAGEDVAPTFKIASLPALVVIDGDGIVRLLEDPVQPPLDALEKRVRAAIGDDEHPPR